MRTVTEAFNVKTTLYLTKPTFFSLISPRDAVTEHDEYWHDHVDRETYGSFDYTCVAPSILSHPALYADPLIL